MLGGSVMAYPMGEAKRDPLRIDFDRRLKLEFHGSKITSEAGLLPYRELDQALGLTGMAGSILTEARRGKNIRHPVQGAVSPIGARPAGRVRGRERRRPAFARPNDADHRGPSRSGPECGFDA